MGRIRPVRAVLAALAAALCAVARPAAAAELLTTIDLNYTYGQQNAGGAVNASTTYSQSYDLKYTTTLTSALDFSGAVKLVLDDTWDTNAATTSRVTPSLELGLKGAQSSVKAAYSGVVSTTEQFHETGEVTTYSNSADLELELMPEYWPELKLKLQDSRDYQLQTTDANDQAAELQLRDEIFDVRTEFLLKLGGSDQVLPQRETSKSIEWSWKAAYKQELYGGTEFEATYEVRESQTEESERGIFRSLTDDYTQSFKTRLRNSLDLTPRLGVTVSWEYGFEQDLLALDFDYKVDNKYTLDVRYQMFSALKLTASAKRDTDLTVNTVGTEDESGVTDTLKSAFDFAPVEWLRFAGKAEYTSEQSISDGSGGSVDRSEDENYELGLKNKFGQFWDLSVNGTYRKAFTDGFIDDREAKVKAALKLKYGDITVSPEYSAERTTSWDGIGEPVQQGSVNQGSIKFEYKLQLVDLLTATFSHDYGLKVSRELDEVLNMERELELSENTRMNVAIAEVIEGLRLEGEIERKGSDTEGDPDPQLVDVSYSLQFDWKIRELTLGSTFKYTDKGATFDDLSFDAKIAWKGDLFDVSGEYQFTKTFAEETEEDRKLNLKMSMRF